MKDEIYKDIRIGLGEADGKPCMTATLYGVDPARLEKIIRGVSSSPEWPAEKIESEKVGEAFNVTFRFTLRQQWLHLYYLLNAAGCSIKSPQRKALDRQVMQLEETLRKKENKETHRATDTEAWHLPPFDFAPFEIPKDRAEVTLLRRFHPKTKQEIPPVYALSVRGLSAEEGRAMSRSVYELKHTSMGLREDAEEGNTVRLTLEVERAESIREYLASLKSAGISFAGHAQLLHQINSAHREKSEAGFPDKNPAPAKPLPLNPVIDNVSFQPSADGDRLDIEFRAAPEVIALACDVARHNMAGGHITYYQPEEDPSVVRFYVRNKWEWKYIRNHWAAEGLTVAEQPKEDVKEALSVLSHHFYPRVRADEALSEPYEIPAGRTQVIDGATSPSFIVRITGLPNDVASRVLAVAAKRKSGAAASGLEPELHDSTLPGTQTFIAEFPSGKRFTHFYTNLEREGITLADLQQVKVQIQRTAQAVPHKDEPSGGLVA